MGAVAAAALGLNAATAAPKAEAGVSLKRVNRKLRLRVNAEMIAIAAPRLP